MSTTRSDSLPDPDDLKREEITFDGGDRDVRLYYHDSISKPLPSVTTITDERVDPDKDDAINGWKDFYDGQTERTSPWWKDQMVFKQYRGTLGHWAIQTQLADLPKGEEEHEAETALQNWADHRPSATDEDIPVFGDPSHYDGEDAWDTAMRDINWVCNQFDSHEATPDIGPEETVCVEQFLYDTEYGYAGQSDLVYDDPETGERVLADLKLSSAVRHDYLLQLAAYARILDDNLGRSSEESYRTPSSSLEDEKGIDRLEVIRLYPDDRVVEVKTHDEWDRTWRGLEHEFLGLVDAMHANYRDQLADYYA